MPYLKQEEEPVRAGNFKGYQNSTVGRYRQDAAGSGQGPVAGSCEHVNEPTGFI